MTAAPPRPRRSTAACLRSRLGAARTKTTAISHLEPAGASAAAKEGAGTPPEPAYWADCVGGAAAGMAVGRVELWDHTKHTLERSADFAAYPRPVAGAVRVGAARSEVEAAWGPVRPVAPHTPRPTIAGPVCLCMLTGDWVHTLGGSRRTVAPRCAACTSS